MWNVDGQVNKAACMEKPAQTTVLCGTVICVALLHCYLWFGASPFLPRSRGVMENIIYVFLDSCFRFTKSKLVISDHQILLSEREVALSYERRKIIDFEWFQVIYSEYFTKIKLYRYR